MAIATTIRMYNIGNLGDCFLLHFQADKDKQQYILIDFGSYESGNEEREKIIAADIVQQIGKNKLIVVLTHQHKDHLSGFLNAGHLLKGKAEKLWLSFLDDEASEQGQTLRKMTKKYWDKNTKAKKLVEEKFGAVPAVKAMLRAKKGFDLFAEEQTGGKAYSALLDMVDHHVDFLTPGDNFFLPGLNEEVKVYVMGPPVDATLLRKLNPGADEEVNSLNPMMELANMDLSGTLLLNALETIGQPEPEGKEAGFPFNRFYTEHPNADIAQRYNAEPERRIDHEWLSEMGRLSLHMDSLTNNSSLVLAFELVRSKKVLLFVGDAQIGNWQSWFTVKYKDSTVTSKDLLSRTVVYKAGHHSSHNATLLEGLNLMNEKELVILIPVDEKVAQSHRFAMLYPGMLMGYHRKSKGRVFRSDTVEQDGKKFKLDSPFQSRENMKKQLTVNKGKDGKHLSIDLLVFEAAQPKQTAAKKNVVAKKKAVSPPKKAGSRKRKKS